MMSRADNRDALVNVLEYLLGATDFWVQKTTVKKNLLAGNKYVFRASVRNQESNYSRDAVVSFYLSRNKKVETKNDLLLGAAQTGWMRGYSRKQIKLNARLPDDLNSGVYFLIAVVAGDGSFLEVNPANDMAIRRVIIY
jgi:hypothetical protein